MLVYLAALRGFGGLRRVHSLDIFRLFSLFLYSLGRRTSHSHTICIDTFAFNSLSVYVFVFESKIIIRFNFKSTMLNSQCLGRSFGTSSKHGMIKVSFSRMSSS